MRRSRGDQEFCPLDNSYNHHPHSLFANASMLLHSMSNGRITLMPQAGKGSQGDDLTVHKLLADFVNNRQQQVWEE